MCVVDTHRRTSLAYSIHSSDDIGGGGVGEYPHPRAK